MSVVVYKNWQGKRVCRAFAEEPDAATFTQAVRRDDPEAFYENVEVMSHVEFLYEYQHLIPVN
jgi:hypothetical protein